MPYNEVGVDNLVGTSSSGATGLKGIYNSQRNVFLHVTHAPNKQNEKWWQIIWIVCHIKPVFVMFNHKYKTTLNNNAVFLLLYCC